MGNPDRLFIFSILGINKSGDLADFNFYADMLRRQEAFDQALEERLAEHDQEEEIISV